MSHTGPPICLLAPLVPRGVVTVETRVDLLDQPLLPGEERCLGRAVEGRRREFVTGRACARLAIERLGLPVAAVLSGPGGEPVWPAGVVGSITHCRGYRGCAVARAGTIASLGVDAEVHAPLPGGVFEAIATTAERARLAGAAAGTTCFDRVLFSAKEAIFKAIYTLTRIRLRFDEADVTIDAAGGTFRGQLAAGARVPPAVSGRWAAREDLVLTTVLVRHASMGTAA